MSNFLNVEDLCFAYLKKPLCLKDVSFSAKKNEKVLILGLDDRGKTTLLKLISGFEDKFFGKVLLNGMEIRTISDRDKNVSLILDYPVLLSGTIDKNLNFLFETLNREVPNSQEKTELLKKVNLNYKLDLNIKKLTSFEKFKLCFLRVFIKKPRALFVDDILKHPFNENEIMELQEILMSLSKDRLLFFAANEITFRKNQDFFNNLNWTNVLYLNNAKLIERQDIESFCSNPFDLDACLFNDKLCFHDGYCINQDGGFYLKIDEKFVIKVDKDLDVKFEALKLADRENEDIVIAYDSNLKVDFDKNNDFNKLLKNGKVMIFSKLDRSRII